MAQKQELVLLVDRSSSTADFSDSLGACLQSMIRKLSYLDKKTLEIYLTLIRFNHRCTDRDVLVDLLPIEEVHADEISFFPKGATNHPAALNLGLELALTHAAKWRQAGEAYNRPIFFLITDGYPDAGSPDGVHWDAEKQLSLMRQFNETAQLFHEMEEAGLLRLYVFSIESGTRAPQMEILQRLVSNPGNIHRVNDHQVLFNIKRFFEQAVPAILDGAAVNRLHTLSEFMN